MGFASKIAASQNSQNSSSQPSQTSSQPSSQTMPSNTGSAGTYGGAPPTGYPGGPPAALRPGGYQQQQQQPSPTSPYAAYPGSPPQASDYAPYGGSPAQPYQPYNHPPSTSPAPYARAPPQQPSSPYPAQPQQGYARPPPPPPKASPMDLQDRPTQDSSPHTRVVNHPPNQPVNRNRSTLGNLHNPDNPSHTRPRPRPHTLDSNSPMLSLPRPGPPGTLTRSSPGGPIWRARWCSPAPSGTRDPQQVNAYRNLLIGTIQEKNLQSFYPPERLDRLVQSLANDAPARLQRLIHEWSVPMEVATDVMKLSLFDVILYVDDSGSIEFEEKGLRKEQLRQILGIVATAASTFDQDGISVRFMNSMETGDGIRSADDVNQLVSRVRFSGLTPLGTSLRSKVIDPLVVGPARANRLDKPVLIITITDGQPAGEAHSTVGDAIRYAVDETSRTRYGRGAVSFQFSQVGNDQRARDFLSDLDEDPHIGQLIDCTSNFEVEQDEMSRANPPVHLTRELWVAFFEQCAKLMLGAIDSSYDTKDEKAAGRATGGAPPAPQGGMAADMPSRRPD
ncbi:hypothetical protein N7462_010508 [Penicillium macrosclerotiorum]|uniref:uncharacterized protein n=1 Tax=Penicillium macrosclerotiorum TaxID=303699 RepID=UPI00254783AB|nr:uncharacterized protein N7462_010508 [Penicillium macrosclerotiorum]KAJ5669438.1 hypothetical protein N7462_010508 [Penicillium macrosclerotiorum]